MEESVDIILGLETGGTGMQYVDPIDPCVSMLTFLLQMSLNLVL